MKEQEFRKERIDRGIKVRSDSIYALMSWRELTYLIFPRFLLIAGLLCLPFLLPDMYWQRVLTIVCVYALLALSFDFLTYFVGLVCLGEAFFLGIGGYIAAVLNTSLGLPPMLTIPMATVGGGALCTVLLLPCISLRGVYFAIVTLMYPLFFDRLIVALNILGGTDGILGVEGLTGIWSQQYSIIIILLVFLFCMRRMLNMDLGLMFRAVRDNDQSVRAAGININVYKALGVFISASIGSLAGAFIVHSYMWAGISLFALDFSILPIAATVIGGGGTLIGPILGCLILVPISELLRAFGTLRIVFYALILTAFIVFRSEGLMVYAQRKYQQFERWIQV